MGINFLSFEENVGGNWRTYWLSVIAEWGPRVDEQNANLVVESNAELTGSHWSWNTELSRLAFEVEMWSHSGSHWSWNVRLLKFAFDVRMWL